MEYISPEGNLIRTARTKRIDVDLDGSGQPASFPSTILDRQPLDALHRYGYRRVQRGPQPDRKYWISTEVIDDTVDGLRQITYTPAPRYTAAQAATALLDNYVALAMPVVRQIQDNIDLFTALGRQADATTWANHLAAVEPEYQRAVAEYQRVLALPTEEEQYQGLVDLYVNLSDYVYRTPE